MNCCRGFALLLVCLVGCGQAPAKPRVVVYCAQDREFAEGLFAEFTRKTGIEVLAKYDTEADKSVSLVAELLLEKDRPRCDVHWNNEPLGSERLREAGAYAHAYHPFAERARVLLVNTEKLAGAAEPQLLFDLEQPAWRGRIVMAKPMFGTTATQVACLAEAVGVERAQQFYRALRANRVAIVPGNKQVAVAVGRGEYDVGLTDTDDAIEEVKAGKPVRIVFPDASGSPDYPNLGTLFLPNTLAAIRNAPHPDAAAQLVEFLKTPATERALAEGASHQFPTDPKVAIQLPAALAPARTAQRMTVRYDRAAREAGPIMQRFLKEEFAR